MNRVRQGTVLCLVTIVLLLAADFAQAINCRIQVSPVNFGTYTPLTPVHLDVTGRIQVRCQAQPGTFEVQFGPGTSGDQTARTLTAGGANILFYNLYRDAGRTQIWGDGIPPTFVVTGARTSRGRPTFYNYPVYGRIFASQAPNSGQYSDSIVVTVLF